MRVVFDTNLVVSGLLWSGTPHQALRAAAEGRVEAITSEVLVDELRDVLKREKFVKYLERIQKTPEELVADYLRFTSVIEPAPVPEDTVRDLEDVKVLEAAVGGRALYIVSGDNDLLILRVYEGITILSPRDFLAWIESGNIP